MPTLLEIEKSIDDILAAHEATVEQAETDEEREEIERGIGKLLDDLATQEQEKVDAYGYLLNRMETEADRLGNIIQNLTTRKQALVNRVQRTREYLLFVFDFAGRKKIEGEMFVARKRESEAVEVHSEEMIPPQYNRVKIEPDKPAIKKAIQNGEEIPGAILTKRESISIGSR